MQIWDQKYLIWVFLGKNFETILSYLKSAPWIGLIAKFRKIMRMNKFETKNALFRYIWARIFKKLLPYLKSAPFNLSKCRIS